MQSQDRSVSHRIIKADGFRCCTSKLQYSHLHFRLPGDLTLGFFSAAGLLEDRSAVDGAGVLLCLMVLTFRLLVGSEQNFVHSLYSPSFIKELGTNMQLGKATFEKCLMLVAAVILSIL